MRHSVAAFKHAPGNANLPIGASKDAIHENGVPRNAATGAAKAVWHSRGYLPHFESAEATQHVAFHLADSLPQTVLLRWKAELAGLPTEKRDVEQRKRVDAWIDAGHGSCVLRSPPIAAMVQESLLTFDAQRYRLLAWVVMPNHVHVLFQPIPHWTVAKIVASWKKFTARKICEDRQDSGKGSVAPVWHREYWDRYIRDRAHLEQAVAYIHENPVKPGLAADPESWLWSGAYSPVSNPGIANLPIGRRKDAIHENGAPRRKP